MSHLLVAGLAALAVMIAGCGSAPGAGGDSGARSDTGSTLDTGVAAADTGLDAPAPGDAQVDVGVTADSGGDSGARGDTGVDAAMAVQICGTRGAGPCPTNQFCQHDLGADCGRADAPGTCQTPPTMCPSGGTTVCGCDGTTYANECAAHMASTGLDHVGPCP